MRPPFAGIIEMGDFWFCVKPLTLETKQNFKMKYQKKMVLFKFNSYHATRRKQDKIYYESSLYLLQS